MYVLWRKSNTTSTLSTLIFSKYSGLLYSVWKDIESTTKLFFINVCFYCVLAYDQCFYFVFCEVTDCSVSLLMGHSDIRYNYSCKILLFLLFRYYGVLFLSISTFLWKYSFSPQLYWSILEYSEQLLACAVGTDGDTAVTEWMSALS